MILPRAFLPRFTDAPVTCEWEDPVWDRTLPLSISAFRPESSNHRPRVLVKAAYTEDELCAVFSVEDRYVIAAHMQRNAPVFQDSCVEWFIKPRPDRGYFAFEINCAGVCFGSYVEKPTRRPDGSIVGTLLSPSCLDAVKIQHSLDGPILQEITEPVRWTVGVTIPIEILEEFTGSLKPLSRKVFRGNFYKCADLTSHPHWASWAPVGALDFHRPADFGELVLEGD